MSFGKTAGRFGAFMALYFALFKILERIIGRFRRRKDSWNAFIAGAGASVALLVEEVGTRWIFAQYLLVRALGCAWTNFQEKHPALDPYAYYGDALLFSLCSGQAVYCFVVRPDTIDPSYSSFLTKLTQMDYNLVRLFQTMMRTKTYDPVLLGGVLEKIRDSGVFPSKLLTSTSDHISCSLIHPGMACLERIPWMAYATFKAAFPMYLSLHLVPPLLLKPESALLRYRACVLAK